MTASLHPTMGAERAEILRVALNEFRHCPLIDALRKTLVTNEDIHGAIDWLVETVTGQWSGPSDLIRPACTDFVLRHVATVRALDNRGS